MYAISENVIDLICKFLSCEEKAAFLSCASRLYVHFSYDYYTRPIELSQWIHVSNFDRFTNVVFDQDVTLHCNFFDRSGGVQVLQSHYPQNVKFIDILNKISIKFIKPAQKTKFININKIRYATYIGNINAYDYRIRNAGIMRLLFSRTIEIKKQDRFLAKWEFKKIAKFYIAHNDFDRFKKLVDTYPISFGDHELLFYTQLMRPISSKIFVYILNHPTTNSSAAQCIQYLICAIEFGMPIELRKKIILEHAALFWNLY